MTYQDIKTGKNEFVEWTEDFPKYTEIKKYLNDGESVGNPRFFRKGEVKIVDECKGNLSLIGGLK